MDMHAGESVVCGLWDCMLVSRWPVGLHAGESVGCGSTLSCVRVCLDLEEHVVWMLLLFQSSIEPPP